VRLVEPSESAAIAKPGIAKEAAIAKIVDKEMRIERRKKSLLGIQS